MCGKKILKEGVQFRGTESPEKHKHFLLRCYIEVQKYRPRRKPCFPYSVEQHIEEIKVDLLHRSPQNTHSSHAPMFRKKQMHAKELYIVHS